MSEYSNDLDINNIFKAGTFYKFNGIVACVQAKENTPEVIERLKQLKNDTSRIAGHTIGEFSVVALDIFGVEKYEGNDNSIKELIASGLWF